MSFFNRVFGAQSSSSASASSSSSSSSSSSAAAGAPVPFVFHPNDLLAVPSANHAPAAAGAAAGSGKATSWEILGDDASLAAANLSPNNPFRDSNPFVESSLQPSARTYFTMVEHYGKVYVFGGFGDNKGRHNDLRFYDTFTQKWELVECKGEIPRPLYLHSAVVWRDSMIIFGGSIGKDSNELYSFSFTNSTWTKIAPNPAAPAQNAIPCARYGHAATVLDDFMYVCGGAKQNNVYFQDSYSYHIPTNTWKRLADIPVDIAYHSLVTYQNKIVLLAGFNGIRFNNGIYTFTPSDQSPFNPPPQWTHLSVTSRQDSILSSTNTKSPPPCCGAAVVIAGDSLLIFGGYTSAGHANDLYRLNFRTNEWSVVELANGMRPVSRAYLQAVFNKRDGYMYVFGGYDGSKCVSDFRRIVVSNAASASDLNLLGMLHELPAKTIATIALQQFAKSKTTSLEEEQLIALFQHLKSSAALAPPAPAAPAPAVGSSSVPAAPPQYPFDTTRMDDFIELGFTRENVLECLGQMHAAKKDTKNFSLVVENLLNFTSNKEKEAEAAKQQQKQQEQEQQQQHQRNASMSVVPSGSVPPPIPPRSASISFTPSVSSGSQSNPLSPATGNVVQPPSANISSLQEQVQRLTEENKDMRTCKVCFDNQIDVVLVPCGHLVACSMCASNMKKHQLECPNRCKFDDFMKVYWS